MKIKLCFRGSGLLFSNASLEIFFLCALNMKNNILQLKYILYLHSDNLTFSSNYICVCIILIIPTSVQ